MIYPTMREDYYVKCWNAKDYANEMDVLLSEGHFIGSEEGEFTLFTLIGKIWQVIRGYLGFIDATQTERVQATWMKFLYYGEAQSLIDESQMERLRTRINRLPQPLDPLFKNLFKEMEDYHTLRMIAFPAHLERMRQILHDYHQRHAQALRPGLWSRWLTPPALDPTKLPFFGDTPLLLAEQALNGNNPQPLHALNYLKQAVALKNSKPAFQTKLAQQLQRINNEDVSQQVQNLFIDLAETAFENKLIQEAHAHLDHMLSIAVLDQPSRIRVGKLYLTYQEDQRVLPYLDLLKTHEAHDPNILFQVARVYWQNKQYTEAVACYESALPLYKQKLLANTTKEKNDFYQKQIARIHDRIGQAYFDNLLPNLVEPDRLKQAIVSFTAAVNANTVQHDYQQHLLDAYQQQWEVDAPHFLATYSADWLHFLSSCESSILEEHRAKIMKMLFNAAEHFFQTQDNTKAHLCLKKALELSHKHVECLLEAINLSVQYQDWEPLEPSFAAWEKEHYANPYLKKCLGDAYWDKQHAKALKKYQEALDLFTKRLAICPVDERQACQDHMAQIRAKMGNDQLQAQPGFFRGVPYEAALQNLQEAYKLDNKHAPQLFDAYLAAAKNESQRTFFRRNNHTIMDYYQQAFNILPQNGAYLQDLMKLYMDYSKYAEALALYQEIQKQPWAQDFNLSADFYSRVGKDACSKKNFPLALDLLRKAYDLQPDNATYKRDYFQQTLEWAKKQYEDLQKDPKEDALLELSKTLKACEQLTFQKVENLKAPYEELLGKTYALLAHHVVKSCWMPQPISMYDPNKRDAIQAHNKPREADYQRALNYYNKALHYQPKSAALYFDKAVLLDWTIEFREAQAAYQKAVEYSPRNPFYHKSLAMMYGVNYNLPKQDEHNEIAKKYATTDFDKDYRIWADEHMSKVKTKEINPHTYPK